MTRVLIFPFAIIGLLSLAVLGKLTFLAVKHRVSLAALLELFFRGLPVGLLCKVKGEMEEWGLIIEMDEIVREYLHRHAQGGRTYAAMADEIRAAVIKARTGRG